MIEPVIEIFKYVKNMLLLDEYPGTEEKALKTYNLFMSGRSFVDKTLSSLYIDYSLNNDFLSSYYSLIETYLVNEKNNEIRFLFLEKL